MNEQTSRIDRLRKSANSRLDSTTTGTSILTGIIILSGVLSAVFFWRHSTAVFAGLPPLLATALGLAIGLLPSEGAFFGWKRIRATKTTMTAEQMKSSKAGLWAAVAFAVTNVIAIFVTSFSDLPAQVQQLSGWIAFFALMLPIPVQFLLYAHFVINEQEVKENHLNAKLAALMFNAYISGEEARIGALLDGMDAELEATLPEYGALAGRENAARALRDGRRDVVGQYYSGPPAARDAGKNTHDAMRYTDLSSGRSYSPEELMRLAEALAVAQREQGDMPNGPTRKPLGRAGGGNNGTSEPRDF